MKTCSDIISLELNYASPPRFSPAARWPKKQSMPDDVHAASLRGGARALERLPLRARALHWGARDPRDKPGDTLPPKPLESVVTVGS